MPLPRSNVAALAVLALTGRITVAEVIVLQIVQGVINAFDTPARQTFVVEMVDDRADVPNAIALNSSMFNASRIVGPAIGGAIIAATGEGWCFLIDAISYAAVIVSLLAMRITRRPSPRERARMLEELRGGVSYVFGFDEDLRGRVMAFYSVAVLGTQPLGSLAAGALAERIGAPRTILAGRCWRSTCGRSTSSAESCRRSRRRSCPRRERRRGVTYPHANPLPHGEQHRADAGAIRRV